MLTDRPMPISRLDTGEQSRNRREVTRNGDKTDIHPVDGTEDRTAWLPPAPTLCSRDP